MVITSLNRYFQGVLLLFEEVTGVCIGCGL